MSNHVAASAAQAAAAAERVARRQDLRRRAARELAASSAGLAAERLASPSAAGDAAEELPDPPTPGYELLHTPGHGRHDDGGGAEGAEHTGGDPHPPVDPTQAALPFHHVDLRA